MTQGTCARGVGVLAALAALAGTPACGRGDAGEGELAGETIAITVQQARLGTLRDVITAPGTVVPSPAADLIVTAPEAAEIVEMPKQEGETVEPGDVLVRLDIPSMTAEIATARLELAEATLALEQARADEARLEALAAQGLAARNQWEAARSARMAAEAALGRVKARFDMAKTMEGSAVIRARFAGVVARRWHAPGDLIPGGDADPILRVVDPSRLQVAVTVAREQAVRIARGQTAVVHTPLGSRPAVVAEAPDAAAEGATTVEVRLSFVEPTSLPLESAVETEIVLDERPNALIIPAAAVQGGESGPFVWIATGEGVASRRTVRLGLTSLGQAQVLTGLMPGDQVIVTGIAQLSEGTFVTISRRP